MVLQLNVYQYPWLIQSNVSNSLDTWLTLNQNLGRQLVESTNFCITPLGVDLYMSQLTLGQLSTNGHSNANQVLIEHQLSVDWDVYQVLIEHRLTIHQDDDRVSTECCSRCLSSVIEHWSRINEDDDWTLTEYWVLLDMSINLISSDWCYQLTLDCTFH